MTVMFSDTLGSANHMSASSRLQLNSLIDISLPVDKFLMQ